MKAIPMTINGMMVSQIINFSLSIISPTEIYAVERDKPQWRSVTDEKEPK